MPPEGMTRERARRTRQTWLRLAGLLHLVAMICVASALWKLTPITMTLSVGGAGMLLALACAIHLVVVVLELRHRDLF